MTEDEARAVSQVFINVHQGVDARLRRGAARRQALAQALARGESPEGPRIDWLRAAGSKVFDVLISEAQRFNAENPDDRISGQDLVDVLINAEALLGYRRS